MIGELASRIVDSVFDVILVIDKDLRIADANSAILEIGYAKPDIAGLLASSLFVDSGGFDKAFPLLVKSAGAGRRELKRFEVKRKDGSTLWMDIGASEIDATGELDYLLVLHDVDERQRTRQALEEQKRSLETMKEQLELANDQLAKRQKVTEQALQEEQKFRLSSQKTGFQKTFVTYLAVLICLSLLLPYLGMIGFLSEKITDSTGNLSLLLIQALTGVSGFIFGQRSGKEQEKTE